MAVALLRLTTMLAWRWVILALPTVNPLRPASSISRPVLTPAIFLKMEPTLGSESSGGWRRARYSRLAAITSRIQAGSPGASWKVAASTTSSRSWRIE